MGGAITILNLGREETVYGSVACTEQKEYEHPNIAVSETRFLGTLLQR